MKRDRRSLAVAAVALLCLSSAASDALRAQNSQIMWLDALCGADPVVRRLHERLEAFARKRQWHWESLPPAAGGCDWTGNPHRPATREADIGRAVELVKSTLRAAPPTATRVVLINSTVAARLHDLGFAVINPKLAGRELHFFSTDPELFCREHSSPDSTNSAPSRLRVGYLRGSARRVEIVDAVVYETGRSPADIDAREVTSSNDFYNLLGASFDGALDIAALVTDDIGATYADFERSVIDRRKTVKPVRLCTSGSWPPRVQPALDGSVSYLRTALPVRPNAPPSAAAALMRPGQEPEGPSHPGVLGSLLAFFVTPVGATETTIRLSTFQDFPVVLAAGPAELSLADDADLKKVLSHSYFEGMYDALAGGLNPCKERSDLLFGVYLLNSYLEDTASTYKGCALRGYYELMSTTPRRPATAKSNAGILGLKPTLAACLNEAPPPTVATTAPISLDPMCVPSAKEKHEARGYGPHYAYYRAGLQAIRNGLEATGAARDPSLRLAEDCLVQALKAAPKDKPSRTCSQFTQGLFAVPYEPSLPLGMLRLQTER